MKLRIKHETSIVIGIAILGLVLGIFPIALISGATGQLAFSPDSVTYMGTSHSLLDGQGFMYYVGTWNAETDSDKYLVIGHYPPGYPLFLAMLQMAGVEPAHPSMAVVNAAILGATLTATGLIAFYLTKRPGWSVLTILATLVTVGRLYVMLWSETAFIALLYISIGALLVFQKQHQRRWLIIAAITLSLAWSMRYAGLVFALIIVGLIFVTPQRTLKRNACDSTLFAILASLPTIAWYSYIFVIEQRAVLFNHQQTSERLMQNWNHFINHWISIARGETSLWGVLLIGSVLIIANLPALWKTYKTHANIMEHVELFRERVTSPSGTLLTISSLYLTFIFVSASTTNVDLDQRMILVVVPAIILAGVSLAQSTALNTMQQALILMGCVLLIEPILAFRPDQLLLTTGLITLAIVIGVILNKKQAFQISALQFSGRLLLTIYLGNQMLWLLDAYSTGLRELAFLDNRETMQWIEEELAHSAIFSPAFDVLYLRIDNPDIYNIPSTGDGRAPFIPGNNEKSLHEFAQSVRQKNGHVVYVDYTSRSYLVSEETLRTYAGFERAVQLPEARIYTVSGELDSNMTVDFGANPSTVLPGGCTTLTWTVSNAPYVILDGIEVSASGQQRICPDETSEFELHIPNDQGELIKRSTVVFVSEDFSLSFDAVPATVNPGECASLRWDMEGIAAAYLDSMGIIGHDQIEVCPTYSTNYFFTIELPDGRTLENSITVNVPDS